ncbi:MAG TPA: DciA family protein [Propioniciclava tarda]|nr:DciA family protein [Propioniciclava tarda]HQA31821.1 DciA family protein [Propioniciclava tarda]HQD61135.1 DciA family protein [Propioniciclava tarda]
MPPPKPRKAKRTRASASGRSRSDPTALGDALGELIAEQGWTTEVSVHALLGRWPSIVGEAVAQHSTPESFVAGIVTIRTDSTAWASQLRLMTPQLLAKLNAAVGEGTIKRLTIKGPDAPSWKHGIRSVRDGRGPRDTYG